jgi:hypothetical protein
MSDMTDRTIEPSDIRGAPTARTDRLVLTATLAGVGLLFAAAGTLWWREGLGVFLEVILSGLSACF